MGASTAERGKNNVLRGRSNLRREPKRRYRHAQLGSSYCFDRFQGQGKVMERGLAQRVLLFAIEFEGYTVSVSNGFIFTLFVCFF